MQVINLDRSTHETVQRLLPWFVVGNLQEAERDLVQEHVRTCTQCQADIEWEQKFRGLVVSDEVMPISSMEAERALQRLHPQLESRGVVARVGKLLRAVGDAWQFSSAGMRMMVAMQFIVITSMGYLLWGPPRDASFHALGQGTSPHANVVVMFKPDTTEVQMREILSGNAARLVDGPTVTGAYLLAIPPNRRTQTLQRLQSEKTVSMAATLDGGEMR